MEDNFIDEVAKALDVFSVERLVLSSPFGTVKCVRCDKLLFTWVQARFQVLRMARRKEVYLKIYECPEQEGHLYHVSDIDKQLNKDNLPGYVRKGLEREKKRLSDGSGSGVDVGKARVLDSAGRPADKALAKQSAKALRVQIQIALGGAVHGVLWKAKTRTHHRFHARRRVYKRSRARTDLPRGELMSKMLSWANGEKFHVDHYWRPNRFSHGHPDKFRRRCRAREAEAVRRMVERERKEMDK